MKDSNKWDGSIREGGVRLCGTCSRILRSIAIDNFIIEDTIWFSVFGKPATQGSKRVFGRGKFAPDNENLTMWRAAVAAAGGEAYGRGELIEDAIVMTTQFTFPRPKSHFGTGKNARKLKASSPSLPIGKPDITKLVRAVEDALTGVVYKDDSQIVSSMPSKMYGDQYVTTIYIQRITVDK